MNDPKVALPLKKFLLVDSCPPDWKGMDLYVIRDETVAFYIGQSHLAFSRVWEHLLGGFHGHSIVGRFIWCNWPASMRFTIELLSSLSEQFEPVGNDLSSAERQLIQHWSPCFNLSQNIIPTPVPESYLPANARFRRPQSLNKLIREAERAVMAEETRKWVEGLE